MRLNLHNISVMLNQQIFWIFQYRLQLMSDAISLVESLDQGHLNSTSNQDQAPIITDTLKHILMWSASSQTSSMITQVSLGGWQISWLLQRNSRWMLNSCLSLSSLLLFQTMTWLGCCVKQTVTGNSLKQWVKFSTTLWLISTEQLQVLKNTFQQRVSNQDILIFSGYKHQCMTTLMITICASSLTDVCLRWYIFIPMLPAWTWKKSGIQKTKAYLLIPHRGSLLLD